MRSITRRCIKEDSKLMSSLKGNIILNFINTMSEKVTSLNDEKLINLYDYNGFCISSSSNDPLQDYKGRNL